MKCCSQCGAYVRHWIDKKTDETHYLCLGCQKAWIEKVKVNDETKPEAD